MIEARCRGNVGLKRGSGGDGERQRVFVIECGAECLAHGMERLYELGSADHACHCAFMGHESGNERKVCHGCDRCQKLYAVRCVGGEDCLYREGGKTVHQLAGSVADGNKSVTFVQRNDIKGTAVGSGRQGFRGWCDECELGVPCCREGTELVKASV